MVKKESNIDIYIITGIISSLIFIVGLLLGTSVGSAKVGYLENELTILKDSLENVELEFFFLDLMEDNITCNYLLTQANYLGSSAGELAQRLTNLENDKGVNEKDYLNLKTRYTWVLLKDWLYLERVKQICDADYNVLLYFYSNKEGVCRSCIDQGFILSYYKEILDDKLMIFALDTEVNISMMQVLNMTYDLKELPAIILNNKKYEGFQSSEMIKNALIETDPSLQAYLK